MISVLLVDDEPLLLEGLKLMIDWKKYGFEICGEATDGNEAFEMIKEIYPHVVVTDINMPLLNGLQLIERSQELMKIPPKFIILSGYDDFSFAQTAMRLNVNNYVLKPIDDIEMEAVLHKLSIEILEEKRLEQAEELQQRHLANHIIFQIIRGEYKESVIDIGKQLLGIDDNMELSCILMEAEDRNGNEVGQNYFVKNHLKKVIQALIDEYYPNQFCHVFEDGADRIGIIVHDQTSFSKHLQALLRKIKKQISLSDDNRILLYFSERRMGIRSIKELYEQTLAARNLKYYREGIMFHFSDLKNLDISEEIGEANFKPLLINLKDKDVETINLRIQEIFAVFTAKHLSIGGIKLCISNLKMELIEMVDELNGDVDDFLRNLMTYDNDFESNNLYSMESYVKEICQFTAEHLDSLTQKHVKNKIFHIIQHVNRHFASPLKLQSVASQYHLNPTYLGQLFRKHTGLSFNEYIHVKRIDEAKKLLKRTNMKISDVAATVGYPDPDYFVCKFKAITNCLPSLFKKSIFETEM